MTEVPPPDWAALYQKHRDAMYRVAASTLRVAGRQDEAPDAVMAAIESLMKSPPNNVQNWEAMLVHVTKNRAKDMLGSAAARRELGGITYERDDPASEDVASEVAERLDRQADGAKLWDSLSILDARHRKVAWEYLAKGRPRSEVAAELEVTPARVSQIATKCLKLLRDELERRGVKR
jgi:RNA polymerase sigma factor (sigma-70 family)